MPEDISNDDMQTTELHDSTAIMILYWSVIYTHTHTYMPTYTLQIQQTNDGSPLHVFPCNGVTNTKAHTPTRINKHSTRTNTNFKGIVV